MQLQPALLGQRHRKLPPWRTVGLDAAEEKATIRCERGEEEDDDDEEYEHAETPWNKRYVDGWCMYCATLVATRVSKVFCLTLNVPSDHEHAKDAVTVYIIWQIACFWNMQDSCISQIETTSGNEHAGYQTHLSSLIWNHTTWVPIEKNKPVHQPLHATPLVLQKTKPRLQFNHSSLYIILLKRHI